MKLHLPTLIPLWLGLAQVHAFQSEKIATIHLAKGAAEILAYDPSTKLLLTNRNGWTRHSVEFISLADPAHPRTVGSLALDKAVPQGVSAISSIAIDPSKRGFAAASLVPKNPTRDRGAVAFIDLANRSLITTATTGYHPDCVVISHDGHYLTAACEGEWKPHRAQSPGSITVFNLATVRAPADLVRVGGNDVPLTASQLAPGVRLPHAAKGGEPANDLEPEYITIEGSTAYVTLQENNALGIFDLGQRRWRPARSFGTWPVRLDPSDRDGPWGGPAAKPEITVKALPQPDTISSFTWHGTRYLVTANEGDNAEGIRVKHLGKNSPSLDPAARAAWKNKLGTDPQNDATLGRLQVSPIDGDTDGDGDIDELTAFGTRSFSIWDAVSGKRIYDSGSLFADIAKGNLSTYNVNDGRPSEWDTRSDNRGAEPEVVKAAIIGGRPIVAVATERQSSIYFFDCTRPSAPRLLGYVNEMTSGNHAPESMVLLDRDQSPTGSPLCIGGWEGSATVTIHQLNF